MHFSGSEYPLLTHFLFMFSFVPPMCSLECKCPLLASFLFMSLLVHHNVLSRMWVTVPLGPSLTFFPCPLLTLSNTLSSMWMPFAYLLIFYLLTGCCQCPLQVVSASYSLSFLSSLVTSNILLSLWVPLAHLLSFALTNPSQLTSQKVSAPYIITFLPFSYLSFSMCSSACQCHSFIFCMLTCLSPLWLPESKSFSYICLLSVF